MALSDAQLEFRKKVIGGSTANIIMSGDSEKIYSLWKQYRGEEEPEDLSDVLQVAVGTATEPVNVEFFQRRTGRAVTNRGSERLSLVYPWMACTLDGLTDNGNTVFEAKTVSPFAKPEEIKQRYYPQLAHNMIVCELGRAVLSVIYGNGHKFEQYEMILDEEYAEILIRQEEHFWGCVMTGEPPVSIAPAAMPVEPIRTADMTGNNRWSNAAFEWLENFSASKKFEKAAKEIKSMVDADVAIAEGHGICAHRNRAGAITISGLKKANSPREIEGSRNEILYDNRQSRPRPIEGAGGDDQP